MSRIFKRKKVWYLDFRVQGRRVRSRVGTSKRLAELALKETEAKIIRNEYDLDFEDLDISIMIDKFLDYHKTNNRNSTAVRYRSVMNHLTDYLAGHRPDIVRLSQLTPEVIEGYKAYRKQMYVNPNGQPINSDDDIKEEQ